MPVQAVLDIESQRPCALQDVMQTPLGDLCEQAWALLPPDEQGRSLTEVFFPPPMRISASPKASEQTFFDAINESARCVMGQVSERGFADEAALTHRLRSLLFQRALTELKRDVYNVTSSGASGHTGAVGEEGPCSGMSSSTASRPRIGDKSAVSASKKESKKSVDRGAHMRLSGSINAPLSMTSTPKVGADRSDKIDSNWSVAPGSELVSTSVPVESHHDDAAPERPEDTSASEVFCDVIKPHAIIPRVLDREVAWSVVTDGITELLANAVASLAHGLTNAVDDGSDALTGAVSSSSTAQTVLLHTAAQLSLRASFEPRAGRAFVDLLRALLERERHLASAASAAPVPAPCSGNTKSPVDGSKAQADPLAGAAAQGSTRLHERLVRRLLVPVLHLIPLTRWGAEDLEAIGQALCSAHRVRVRNAPLGENELSVSAHFTVKATVSLRSSLTSGGTKDASPATTIAAATEEASTGNDRSPRASSAALQPHLGGENGDEWVWGHEREGDRTAVAAAAADRPALEARANQSTPEQEGEGRDDGTGAVSPEPSPSETQEDAYSDPYANEDSEADLDAPPFVRVRSSSSESSEGGEEETQRGEEGAPAHSRRSPNSSPQKATNTLDSAQQRMVVFRTPHAKRVSIRVSRVTHGNLVRLVLLPLNLPAAGGDVLPICETPVAGEAYDREGPCEVQVMYVPTPASEAAQRTPELTAEVRADMSLTLDGRWEAEWALALLHAQRHVASALLAELRTGPHQAAPAANGMSVVGSPTAAPSRCGDRCDSAAGAVELPRVLFGYGPRTLAKSEEEDSPVSPPCHPFVASVRALSDNELRLRTRCRASDLPGVRAVLEVIAYFFTTTRPDVAWGWKTADWLDAVRRVSLASASLDKRLHAGALAEYIVRSVEGNYGGPAAASPTASQVVDAVISFFSRGAHDLSAEELAAELARRSVAAQHAITMLRLLESACDLPPSPKSLTLIAKALKSFLMIRDGAHYLTAFTGCGPTPEAEIRLHVHRTTSKLYALLRSMVARAEKAQGSPHKFLLQSWEYGAFAVLTLSLLASQLDTEDIGFVTRGIANQVTAMLPDFTSFTRTESFLVSQGEEVNFGKVFAEYFCASGAETAGVRSTDGRAGTGGTGASLRGQLRGGWETRGEAIAMAGARQDSPQSFSALLGGNFCFSKEPVFTHEWMATGGATALHVQLLNDSLSKFYVGLATPSLGFVRPNLSQDADGIYYLVEAGELVHGATTTSVPPVRAGDTLSFVFGFEATQWRLTILRNGYVAASVVLPRRPLHLVLGCTDNAGHGAQYRGTCGRPPQLRSLFEDDEDVAHSTASTGPAAARYPRSSLSPSPDRGPSHRGAFPSSPVWTARRASLSFSSADPRAGASLSDVRRLRLLYRGPHMKPTFYNTSLFAVLVFHYLVVSCAKKQRQQQHQLQRSAAATAASLLSPAAGASSGTAGGLLTPLSRETEGTLRRFVDSCCTPLRRNVQLLVRSLSTMPSSDRGGAAPEGSRDGSEESQSTGSRTASISLPSLATCDANADGEDSTERVKRQTAVLVYNNLLLDYTISLAVTLRATSSPVEALNALTDVVCCREAAAKPRSVALSAAYNAITAQSNALAEEAAGGFAASSASSATGGFGLFAFNPDRLWRCCAELASGTAGTATSFFRPTFVDATVPCEMAVKSGGRAVVYKPGGPQRSAQRTVSYAKEGIPLDGSRGDLVTFAARLQRAFQTDSLGRLYYVGVACCTANDDTTRELRSYPGDRRRQFVSYAISDYFQDVTEPRADQRGDVPETRVELRRHEANWLSADDGIVFGSGDVITVSVHCKERSVSFERNGKPLGTLFRKLPASVKVLFPFIELYNRDSMGKWMYTPDELLVQARYAMRAMLRFWTLELTPRLQDMITHAAETDGDCTALQVLGADGDELSQVYRAPPRSELLATVKHVRLVRTEGRLALVEDESGATHRVVDAALEPNHAAPMRLGDALSRAFVPALLQSVLTETQLAEDMVDGQMRWFVTIRHPAALLRILRLLSETEGSTEDDVGEHGTSVAVGQGGEGALRTGLVQVAHDSANAEDPTTVSASLTPPVTPFARDSSTVHELRAAVVNRLLELLKVQTLDLPGDVLLREAWNEICWTPSPEQQPCLRLSLDERATVPFFPPPPTSPGAGSTTSVKSCISLSSSLSLCCDEDGAYALRCPTCGEEWGSCSGHHAAPSSTCVQCHQVLRRLGLTSPFCGWFTTWRSERPVPLPSLIPSSSSPTAAASASAPAAQAGTRGDVPGVLVDEVEGDGAVAAPHSEESSVPHSAFEELHDEDFVVAEGDNAGEDDHVLGSETYEGAAEEEEEEVVGGIYEYDEEEEENGGEVHDEEDDEEDEEAFDTDDDYGFDDQEENTAVAPEVAVEGGNIVAHDIAGGATRAAEEADRSLEEAFHPVFVTFEATDGDVGPTVESGHVRGNGETKNGVFTFEGHLVSATVMKGRIVFAQGQSAEDSAGSGEADLEVEWSCAACTFVNTPDVNRCAICATPRPGAMWSCPVCSYAYNPNSAARCATCGELRRGAAGTLQALLGGRTSDRPCYCEGCHAAREFRHFKDLSLYQFCDDCQRETRWLPKDSFSGMMEARIVGEGDKLEFTWHVDGSTQSAYGLSNEAYSAPQLLRLLREKAPASENRLNTYVPPLARPSVLEETAMRRAALTPIQACLPSAIAYFASRLVLLWGPVTNPGIFTDAEVLTRLLVYAEDWLEPLRAVSLEAARGILHTCLSMLFAGVESPHVVQAIASAARVLMSANPSLRGQRHYLLYALSVTACRCGARRTREVCYSALAKLFEDYPHETLNAQCLGIALRRQPMVAGQQRVIVHAVLRHVAVGEVSTASTKAASCLARTIVCMERSEPIPRLLDHNISDAFPYVVALAETRVNEGGQLQVGQIRGSVGYAPTKGGRYYYEVVLPQNFTESSNTIVMGWGTLQHEHLSSSQHVGSDLHSWGFNCRDRLKLMAGEQLVAVPQRPAPGDVIGSMMDLETMMVCWSVNGEPLMWVSVPAQGESEEIYPFVSAAVEPCGVEIRLGNTQFTPEDYRDYSPPSDVELWSVKSDAAAPQSYAFYQELCALLDEVSATDLAVRSSVLEALCSPRAQRALPRYPSVLACIEHVEQGSTPTTRMSTVLPYVQHLSAISDLTVMVARNYPVIEGSPFLTQCYRKAQDLLFSGARWVIFETQMGGRPTFSAGHSRTVRIDLAKARLATEEEEEGDEAHPQSILATQAASAGSGASSAGMPDAKLNPKTEQLALTQSVTGQLFRQIENAPVYKNATMFTVRLANDVTNDAGGVTRSILSMIADELNFQFRHGARVDPAVPLFKLCGHSTVFTVVPNMERLLFEADRTLESDDEDLSGGGDEERLGHRMLTWLGMIMGNVTLCGTMKLTLNFPRIAWKYFTFATPTIEDYYYDVDDTVRGSLADDDFLLNDEYYYSIPGILQQQQQQQQHVSGIAGPEGGLEAAFFSHVGRRTTTDGVHSAAAAPSSHPLAAHTATALTSAKEGLGRGLARPLRPYSCMTPAVSVVDLSAYHHQPRFSRATSRANLSSAALADFDMADEEALVAASEAATAAARAKEARRRRHEAEQALLHQYDAAFECMRNGLASVLSVSLLRAIRWDDLQTRICGAPNTSAEHVMAYLDWSNVQEGIREMLSQVLTDMTERERGQFLLFCSGQSRLPLPEKISVTCGDDATLIPTAHTCSPISLRLQPYASTEDMRQKLSLCLSHAKQFGFV